jgi:hypothetical protein
MEATMFTGWIYDHLKPHAAALKVAHPLMLRASVWDAETLGLFTGQLNAAVRPLQSERIAPGKTVRTKHLRGLAYAEHVLLFRRLCTSRTIYKAV